MDIYTEDSLKNMNKAQLLEIATKCGIEVVDGASNADIKALILEKVNATTTGSDSNDSNSDNSEQKEDSAPTTDGDNPTVDSAPKFTKKQILESNWYSHRRDMLSALLVDDEMYSHVTVNKLIKKFLKERVK